MPDEKNNDGLPQGLRARLDEAIPLPRANAGGEARQWSLSDIDKLLQEVSGSVLELPGLETIALAPELRSELVPEPELMLKPEPKLAFVPKSEPEAEPELALVPEPESEPAPTQQTITIRAADVTEPAPEPDPLRFDLFRDGPLKPPADPPTRSVWDEPVEKPGVLLRRVDMQMTSDLSPVPTVVPADEMYVRPQPERQEDIPEGQQRLADFDEEPKAHSVEEEEMLARLEKSKLERTTQFKTLRSIGAQLEKHGETRPEPPEPAQPETEPALEGAPEYRDQGQRDSVFRLLQRLRSRRASSALALGALVLLAAGLQLAAFLLDAFNLSPGHLAAMALLLVGGIFICAGDFSDGFKALVKRKPNANTALLLAALLSTAQMVLMFVFRTQALSAETQDGGVNPYWVAPCVPLFLFAAALCTAARWQQARQRCDNFRFCAFTSGDNLYAAAALNARDAAKTPRQSALPGRARTVLPVPVSFPAGFLRQSMKEDAADQGARQLLPVAAGLAVVAGLSAFLLQHTAVAAVSAAAVAACLCVPGASLWLLASMLRALTRGSREDGVAILNTDAAQACSKAGAFVLDSADLYLPAKGRMHGWREFRQVRADEVLLYAAGIAIAAGGPLQAVFDGVVDGDYSVLPDVKDMIYEDRMGLSCWIHNQKVLFGNRALLENHGIPVILNEKDEQKYEHDGRKIIYLAVDKRLSAFFVVSYCPDTDLAPVFRQLEKEDTEALICNSDPCVGADVLTEAFGLREGSLSLLRSVPSEICRKQMSTPRANLGAGVYHAGNARAFLRALSACVSLQGGIKRLKLFQLVGSVMACAILLLFVFMGQLHAADSLIFIALQLVWAAVMHAVAKN